MKVIVLSLFIFLFSYIKHTSDKFQYFDLDNKIYRLSKSPAVGLNFPSEFQYMVISNQDAFSYKNYYFSMLDILNFSIFKIIHLTAYPLYPTYKTIYIIDSNVTPCGKNQVLYADTESKKLQCVEESSSSNENNTTRLNVFFNNYQNSYLCKKNRPECAPPHIIYTSSQLITEAINCVSIRKDTAPLLFEVYLAIRDLHSNHLNRIASCYKDNKIMHDKLKLLIDFKIKRQTFPL